MNGNILLNSCVDTWTSWFGSNKEERHIIVALLDMVGGLVVASSPVSGPSLHIVFVAHNVYFCARRSISALIFCRFFLAWEYFKDSGVRL